MTDSGSVSSIVSDSIARITFEHPRSNSLPGGMLSRLAQAITSAGSNPDVRVVLLQSTGQKAFCAGASFDELLNLKDGKQAQEFFMGFAHVILAIRNCRRFVVARVQGKSVGGGVGLIAACDLALATQGASIKLSEYALGFGPFVISAAVQRKIGTALFSQLAIDTEWRDAAWCERSGLYSTCYPDIKALDDNLEPLLAKLASRSPQATAELKTILWSGTEHWPELLPNRAAMSSQLVLGDVARQLILDANG